MSLGLEPGELGFKRPFDKEVMQSLRLINSSALPIAFKVKTTAPKQYCVRPNSGKVEAGGTVEVSVVLQPMKQDPPLDARCKDKFLVQSVQVPATQEMPPWSELEKAADFKSMVQERKIKVIYLAADSGETTHVNGADESTFVDDSIVSPPPQYTPRGGQDESRSEPETPLKASDEGLRRRAPVEPDSPSSTIVSTSKELAQEAVKTATKVKDSASQQLQQMPTVQGVPVPTVALLCLVVFLLTYFLF